MIERNCYGCKRRLPLTAFKGETTERRAKCLECLAASRKRTRHRNRPKDRSRQQQRIDAKRDFARQAKSRPCMDCGKSYPYYVMDFDHRLGVKKLAQVSDLTAKDCNPERLQAEIAKCDVVCANCHRERTHQRKIFE